MAAGEAYPNNGVGYEKLITSTINQFKDYVKANRQDLAWITCPSNNHKKKTTEGLWEHELIEHGKHFDPPIEYFKTTLNAYLDVVKPHVDDACKGNNANVRAATAGALGKTCRFCLALKMTKLGIESDVVSLQKCNQLPQGAAEYDINIIKQYQKKKDDDHKHALQAYAKMEKEMAELAEQAKEREKKRQEELQAKKLTSMPKLPNTKAARKALKAAQKANTLDPGSKL